MPWGRTGVLAGREWSRARPHGAGCGSIRLQTPVLTAILGTSSSHLLSTTHILPHLLLSLQSPPSLCHPPSPYSPPSSHNPPLPTAHLLLASLLALSHYQAPDLLSCLCVFRQCCPHTGLLFFAQYSWCHLINTNGMKKPGSMQLQKGPKSISPYGRLYLLVGVCEERATGLGLRSQKMVLRDQGKTGCCVAF